MSTADPSDVPVAHDPFAMSLGRRIAQLRQEAELDSAALARLAGMAPAYLWRVEQGRTLPSLRNIARIAAALSVPLPKLLEHVDISSVDLENRIYGRSKS